MAMHRESHEHCVVAVIRVGEVAQLVGAAKAVLLLWAVVLHLQAILSTILPNSPASIFATATAACMEHAPLHRASMHMPRKI